MLLIVDECRPALAEPANSLLRALRHKAGYCYNGKGLGGGLPIGPRCAANSSGAVGGHPRLGGNPVVRRGKGEIQAFHRGFLDGV